MTTLQRFALLARQDNPLFHSKDLGVLWNINNANTLYTLLKRYAKKRLLFRIYKGLYSLKPIEKISPELMGTKALHGFCYISCESILEEHGIIFQRGQYTTFVSEKSLTFSIGNDHYLSRQLKDEFLYNPFGIIDKNGIKKASLHRAIADLLYFNPKAFIDNKHPINIKTLKKTQSEIGYPLTPSFYADSAQRRHSPQSKTPSPVESHSGRS